jgi:hypothetical protein
MTQHALAEAIGRTDVEISHWTNLHRPIPPPAVPEIAAALGVPVDDLVAVMPVAGGSRTGGVPPTEDEIALIGSYRRLSRRDRRVVRALIEALGD